MALSSKSTFMSYAGSSNRKSLTLRQGSEADSENTDVENFLDLVRGLTWDVYHVSPWFNFDDDEIRLKQYSLQLRNSFIYSSVDKEAEYSADVKIARNIGRNRTDSVVKVSVESKKGEVQKPIYVGLFCSWGAARPSSEEFLNVPILLCRGYKTSKNRVHQAISTFFDCIITPHNFTQKDMMWMNSVFISTLPDNLNKNAYVSFILDAPWDIKASLTYKVLLADLQAIWNKIHNDDDDVLKVEEVQSFYYGILNNFEIITLNVKYCRMNIIDYPGASFKSSGKIKINSSSVLDEILSYLNSEPLSINSQNLISENSNFNFNI